MGGLVQAVDALEQVLCQATEGATAHPCGPVGDTDRASAVVEVIQNVGHALECRFEGMFQGC